MYLDDDGSEPRDEAAEARYAALSPEERTLHALEFQALAQQLAARSIRIGQGRAGFVSSLVQIWEQQRRQFAIGVAAHDPPPAAPPEHA